MIGFLFSRVGLTILGILGIIAAVLGVLFKVRQSGKLAERVEYQERSLEIKKRQLDVLKRAPRTDADLDRVLRDGEF